MLISKIDTLIQTIIGLGRVKLYSKMIRFIS